MSHGLVFAALAWKPFAQSTGTTELSLVSDVLGPWALRMAPMVLLAFAVQRAVGTPPLPATIAIGGALGAAVCCSTCVRSTSSSGRSALSTIA